MGKKLTAILAVVVVAIVVVWLNSRSEEEPLMLDLETPGNESDQQADFSNQPIETLEGLLELSDDSSRGNLMLITADAVIYINTSRDFSSLVGKKVVVSVDGNLENFTLLSIEENL